MQKLALLLVAFLSGAILMALEIVGSRVLAPCFGGSIYVWGSLIGVFLGALSLGYYLGGRLVDRWPRPGLLAGFLLLSGILVVLMPLYGSLVCDSISIWDFGDRAGPLVACLTLFFFPGMLMGTTSPFVIRLTARTVNHVGQTAGAVYAISTVGSIAGTLGTAFYLLSWLGLRNILFLLGALLILTALTAAVAGKAHEGRSVGAPRPTSAALAALLALAAICQPACAKERILLERDSAYHRLFVTEEGNYRWLRADNIWHTQMNLQDRHGRGLPYSDYVDLAFLFNPKIRSVLVIGLGGGTIPKRFVRDYPQVKVDAVEVDGDVVKIAASYFDVRPGPRLRIFTADGRPFLRRSKAKYDLIVLDAYYADTVPFFLTTREFFDIVKEHLTAGGVFANNTMGTLSGSKSKFYRSVYRTMKETFGQVYAFKVPESGSPIMNVELFALNSKGGVSVGTLRERALQMQSKVIKDPDLLAKVENLLGRVRTDDVPTLTDDYAPVDALLHLW